MPLPPLRGKVGMGGGDVDREKPSAKAEALIPLFHTPSDRRQRASGGQELAVARLLLQFPLI